MEPAERDLRSHLVPDEPLCGVAEGRLVDEPAGGRAAIALTDRRVLCRSAGGGFVDVDYASISSIRSWSRSRLSVAGVDSTLVALASATVAVLAFFLGLVTAARARPNGGLLGVALVLATVLGVAAFEYVRRRRRERPVDRRVLGAGALAAALAVVAFVAIAATVSRVAVPLLLLVTGAGLVLADYAARLDDEYDGVELDRRRETELAIHTVDGNALRVVVDVDADVDRELSRLAAVGRATAPETTPQGSVAE